MNGNFNNTNTENFFGLQNIEALLNSAQADKLGKKFGKEFAAALEKAIIEKDPFEKGMKGYSSSLRDVRAKMEQTFKDVKFDAAIKRSINDTLDKAEKQALSLKQRFADVYAQIEKENKKSDKDLNKMLQLTQQLYSIQNEFNVAQATTVDNVEILVQENNLRIEQSKVIAENEAYHRQESELLLQKKKLINATDEQEIAALQKKISLSESELNLAKNKLDVQKDSVNNLESNINQKRRDVANVKSNFNSESEMNNKVFSDAKETLKDLDKDTTSVFKKWSSGIESIAKEITKVFDLWNLMFNNTENVIEGLNQEFGERWKIRNDISKNIGGADFNDYQTGIYNSAIAGDMRGMFNESELKEHLVSMSEYLFETKEAAIENSQLIAYGNKFLGMSNESMKSIYNLEKMTNGDGFIRSQLQTITKLQNSGLVTSQAQLDKLTTLASNAARELSELGLQGDAAQSFQSSMTEVMAVLDSKVYEGAGKDFQNKIVEALKDPTGAGVELFGNNMSRVQQIVNSGDRDVAWQLYDLIQGSPYAAKTRELSANGYSISSAIAGQQFTNAGFYNAIGSNASQIEKDRALLSSMGLEDYLAKSQEKDSKQVDERTKWLNKRAVDKANGQYDVLVEQAMSTGRIESYVKSIEGFVRIISTVLKVVGGIEAGGKLAGLTIGKASGLSAVGGVASIAAGTGWMLYDGITGGMNGVTDENGNYIMEEGIGTGLVTAVGGKKVNAESYQGKLTGAAKEDNMLGSMGSGAAKGALIGAGIGTFFGPGIGTAIGAGIGGLVGGIAGLFAGNAKNKEAEEYAKKQYEEQKRLTEINQEMLDIAKRGNAALAYRYAIDTSVMGSGSESPAMGGESMAMGSSRSDVLDTGLLTGPWGCSRGYEWSTKYVDGKPTNQKSFHNGIDLTAPGGTPIGAPVSGEVIHVGALEGDAGNNLTLKGDNGLVYRFLHMSEPSKLSVGDRVNAGSLVGFVGTTGNSSGNHLHLGVKSGKDWVDPISYLNSYLFGAKDTYDTVSSSSYSDIYDTSKSNLAATMRTASRTHFVAAGGDNGKYSEQQIIDINPIVSGLETVNNTIKELGERQDAQQKILDALTVRPIPSLGI